MEQINVLLGKKDKLLNLPINSNKLSMLVMSLNKLSDMGEEINLRNQRKKKTRLVDISQRLDE